MSRTRRAGVALAVVLAVALALGTGARAEMPENRDVPEVTGRAAVGEILLGHNGTWLYLDGSGCAAECSFAFRWERCASSCVTVSTNRGYRPRLVDLRRHLQLAVTATKYDCGAVNYAAGTQECRFVSRTAYAEPVWVGERARVAARAVAWPARLRIERAAGRGRAVTVTVADTLGRLVVGATVSAAARDGRVTRTRTRADGTALVARPGKGPLLVVARAGVRVAKIRVR